MVLHKGLDKSYQFEEPELGVSEQGDRIWIRLQNELEELKIRKT